MRVPRAGIAPGTGAATARPCSTSVSRNPIGCNGYGRGWRPSRNRRGGRCGRSVACGGDGGRLLFTFGLFGWVGPGEPGVPYRIAARGRAEAPPPAVFAPGPPEAMMARNDISPKASDAAKQAVVVYSLDLGGKTSAEFRADVRAAARSGLPPPPPAVDLELTVRNPGRDAVSLRLEDKETELLLDLQGPGALDAPAPHAPAPLAGLGVVRLAGRRIVFYSDPQTRHRFSGRGALPVLVRTGGIHADRPAVRGGGDGCAARTAGGRSLVPADQGPRGSPTASVAPPTPTWPVAIRGTARSAAPAPHPQAAAATRACRGRCRAGSARTSAPPRSTARSAPPRPQSG